MVAISIPDHLGGMTGLPFTSASQSRQHTQAGLGLGHGYFGVKTEENVGLGLMDSAGMGMAVRNENENGGGEGGNGYQDGFSHPFGSMGNAFTGMDFSIPPATQGQGGRQNSSGSSFDSGVNPSALMNLAQSQRMQQQQHAQQQHRQQLYDSRITGDAKRTQAQLQPHQAQRHNMLINGSASVGSGISAYSELASPDSDPDGDNGGQMTGSGGESLASSMIMAAHQAEAFGQTKGPSVTFAPNDSYSVDNVNASVSTAPSSGKVTTKRGPKTGKKDQAQTAEEIISGKTGKPLKPKSRKRVNTAEKRASHNAVERMRREQLNEKFLDLARLLPALANLRRPSKSAIVNSSISHLSLQREQRLLAANELRTMHADYAELLAEVQDWRSRNGVACRENNVEWSEAMNEICSVEAEVFGVFTGVGGTGDDNEGDGDDNDGDDNMEEEESKDMMDLQQAMDTKRHSGASDIDVKPFAQGSRMPASALYANRQMSFQTTASVEEVGYSNNIQESPQGSNGAFSSRSVITPPAHGIPILTTGFATSPTSSTRQAFGAVSEADQVATWAAQQAYLQYAQAQQAKRLDSRATFADGSGVFGRHAVLDVTQQMLNVSHPHLAASVFPPPISIESPPNEGSYAGSFMTSTFAPNQSAPGTAPSADQVEMWQKLAAGHFQGNVGRAQAQQHNMPTISQLKEALRAGMSVGMGLANETWAEQ